MKIYQAIGYMILHTTAITNVISTRCNHGLRPASSVMPCINYYGVGGTTQVADIVSSRFSINCRAADPGIARDLARSIAALFGGSQGNGIYGTTGASNTFGLARCSVIADGGLIPEPTEGAYNAPIDILVVHSTGET